MRTNATATFTAFVDSSGPRAGTIVLAGLTVHIENAATVRASDLVVIDAELDGNGAWHGRLVRHLINPLADQGRPAAGYRHEKAATANPEGSVQAGSRTSPYRPAAAPSQPQATAAQRAASHAQSQAGSRASRFGGARTAAPNHTSHRATNSAPQPPRTATEAAKRPPFQLHEISDDQIPF